MNITFITRPIQGFFRTIGLWLWPKKIHLAYGRGGMGTQIETAVRDHLNSLGLHWTWYFLGIDEVWNRPNQVFFVCSDLKGNHRDTAAKRYAKKFNTRVIYFTDLADLKKKASEYAAE